MLRNCRVSGALTNALIDLQFCCHQALGFVSLETFWQPFLTIYVHSKTLSSPVIQCQHSTLFFLKQFSIVWKVLMSGKLQARMACRTGSYETTHSYFANRFKNSKNDMLLNENKTKEMVLGPCSKVNRPKLLLTSSGCIERVTQFKLLGVFIDSTLSRNAHIDYIVKKAA